MKFRYITSFIAIALTSGLSMAQTPAAQTPAAQTPVVEDFKVSSTTQFGKQYPQVNSEGRVQNKNFSASGIESADRYWRCKV